MTTSRATEEAMAKDETQDNTREWVWLSVYVDRTTDEVLSPELARTYLKIADCCRSDINVE